jgi:hypothetical protein
LVADRDVRVFLSHLLTDLCTVAAARDARRTVVMIRANATIGEVVGEMAEVLTTTEHNVIRAAYGWPPLPAPLPAKLLAWPLPVPPLSIRARAFPYPAMQPTDGQASR